MYYEINVSKKTKEGDYAHHFATASRSCESKAKTKILVREFTEKFPEPLYRVYVTLHTEQSFGVNLNDLLNE